MSGYLKRAESAERKSGEERRECACGLSGVWWTGEVARALVFRRRVAAASRPFLAGGVEIQTAVGMTLLHLAAVPAASRLPAPSPARDLPPTSRTGVAWSSNTYQHPQARRLARSRAPPSAAPPTHCPQAPHSFSPYGMPLYIHAPTSCFAAAGGNAVRPACAHVASELTLLLSTLSPQHALSSQQHPPQHAVQNTLPTTRSYSALLLRPSSSELD